MHLDRRMWIVLLVLGAMLMGCFCQTCSPNKCKAKCERSGLCQVRYKHTGESLFRCYAGSDVDCSQSQACQKYGRCFATETGACVRQEQIEQHRCAVSSSCIHFGGCSPTGQGYCEPTQKEHCQKSKHCLERGRCKLVKGRLGDAYCTADDDASCQNSQGCKTEGKCGKVKGVCAPTGVEHCQNSQWCKDRQQCDFEPPRLIYNGRCVHRPKDNAECQASYGCKAHGKCAYAVLDTIYATEICTPTQSSHCEQSDGCKLHKQCTYKPPRPRDGKIYNAGRCVREY